MANIERGNILVERPQATPHFIGERPGELLPRSTLRRVDTQGHPMNRGHDDEGAQQYFDDIHLQEEIDRQAHTDPIKEFRIKPQKVTLPLDISNQTTEPPAETTSRSPRRSYIPSPFEEVSTLFADFFRGLRPKKLQGSVAPTLGVVGLAATGIPTHTAAAQVEQAPPNVANLESRYGITINTAIPLNPNRRVDPDLVKANLEQQSGHKIPSVLFDYWLSNGGLEQQGYAVSDPITETSKLDGKAYQVQYFERSKFEYHPEQKDPKYQVLLGFVGKNAFDRRYSSPTPEDKTNLANAKADTVKSYEFPENGKHIGDGTGFKSYYELHGGKAQFGLPLTEPFNEKSATDGKVYTVQYFERGKFEYHPDETNPQYKVMLGLLGTEDYNASKEVKPAPTETPAPKNVDSISYEKIYTNPETGHTINMKLEGTTLPNGAQFGIKVESEEQMQKLLKGMSELMPSNNIEIDFTSSNSVDISVPNSFPDPYGNYNWKIDGNNIKIIFGRPARSQNPEYKNAPDDTDYSKRSTVDLFTEIAHIKGISIANNPNWRNVLESLGIQFNTDGSPKKNPDGTLNFGTPAFSQR